MADMLADAATWMVDTMASVLAQTVTYRRGGLSVSLAATKCPVRSELDPQFGVLRMSDCDWIVKAASLVLGGATVEPQKNDVIEEAGGQKWQVLPTETEQEFRPSDPYRTAWRIHTKRIDGPD